MKSFSYICLTIFLFIGIRGYSQDIESVGVKEILEKKIPDLIVTKASPADTIGKVVFRIDDRPFELKYPEAKVYYFQDGRLIDPIKAPTSEIDCFDGKSFDADKGHVVIFIHTKKSVHKKGRKIYPKISIDGKVASYADLDSLDPKKVLSFDAVGKKRKSELIIKTK